MEEELEIPIQRLNPTESRVFALLFLLFKESKGLSFQSIRNKMSHYYNNPEFSSDRKKFQRDLDELRSLGFNIKVATYGFEAEDQYLYYLVKRSIDQEILFSPEELDWLSKQLVAAEDQNAYVLFFLAEKLLANNLDSFPENFIHSRRFLQKVDTSIPDLLQAIRDKSPISIQYADSKRDRWIEPYRLVRKGIQDFYLLAYDVEKKATRHFQIGRIRISKISRETFISNLKPKDLEPRLHPLLLHFHEVVQISVKISPNFTKYFELFLQDLPCQTEDSWYTFHCSNRSALFPLFSKYPGMVEDIKPQNFIRELNQYKKEWAELLKNEN